MRQDTNKAWERSCWPQCPFLTYKGGHSGTFWAPQIGVNENWRDLHLLLSLLSPPFIHCQMWQHSLLCFLFFNFTLNFTPDLHQLVVQSYRVSSSGVPWWTARWQRCGRFWRRLAWFPPGCSARLLCCCSLTPRRAAWTWWRCPPVAKHRWFLTD